MISDSSFLVQLFVETRITIEDVESLLALEILTKRFNSEEIRTLCFNLRIDYEILGGEGKGGKARELLLYVERRNRIQELVLQIKTMRGDISWETDLTKRFPFALESSDWKRAGSVYYQKIKNENGFLRILGQQKPVSLEGIFTDVFVLDKPSSWRRFTIEQLKDNYTNRVVGYTNVKRLNGLDLVRENQSLFVFGKPGAGKTTFLKYVAIQAINGIIPKIPIIISLKELADSELNIFDFILKQFEVCELQTTSSFLQKILKSDKTIILFDGLDEVNQEKEKRAKLIDELKNFMKNNKKAQYLITCRVAATDYLFKDVTYVEMADFSPSQVKFFVKKWFTTDEVKQKTFMIELNKADNKGLSELAKTPLLLTLLCLAFEETLIFPHRRVDLYEEAIDALLKKWDSSRNIRRDEIYRSLSIGRKRQLFSRLAALTFEKGKYFIPKRFLVSEIAKYLSRLPPMTSIEDIDGEAILISIVAQHGIFIERAAGIFSFGHLTFQEYFTAKYIVDNVGSNSLATMAQKVDDDNWREVFLLTSSLLDNATALFNLSLRRLNQLVKSEPKIEKLLKWVNKKVRSRSQKDESHILATRSMYLYLAVVLDRDQDQILANLTTVKQIRRLALNLGQKVNHYDPEILIELGLALILDCTRPSARELGLSHDLGNLFPHKNGGENSALEILEVSLAAAIQLNDPNLTLDLTKLVEMSSYEDDIAFKKFFDYLTTVIVDRRKLGLVWDLSKEDFLLLKNYLAANFLLLDCLDLAYVDNRQSIENALLNVA